MPKKRMQPTRMIRVAWISFSLLLACTMCEAAERFAARFADESQLHGDVIEGWSDLATTATLSNRQLFDDQIPIRWLTDRTQPPASQPTSYVEFAGGDILAGAVIAYCDGSTNRFESTPPHLLMKPFANIYPPEVVDSSGIRITLTWVRRIVWNSRTARDYKPGTIWPLTGNSYAFRSLRWTERGLTALTTQGLKQFAFDDLSELHFPQMDPWNAYYEQLAWLSPNANTRLIQLNLNDGSRLTTSFTRFQSRHVGEKARPDNWLQFVQPAWSLDPLWLRFRTIRNWLFFSPTEVPLSRFAPLRTQHQPVFGSSFNWRIDQSALQTPLRSETQEFGWGWGVHGTTDLEFELPEITRAIRTRYGLDRTVSHGGCVNVQVLLNGDLTHVDHRHLVGNKFVGDSDWIERPAKNTRNKVTFRTEMAHDDRPTGADPFDIRDTVNWYEPEVRLDPEGLNKEVANHNFVPMTGLNGWTLSPKDRSGWKVTNILDSSDKRDPLFRSVGRANGPFYSLSRQFKFGKNDRWLTIMASRFAETTTPSLIHIRINGRVLAATEIPVRDSMADPRPILVPLESITDPTATVELVIFPTDDNSWVDWRGTFTSPECPGVLSLFDDDPAFASSLTEGHGRIEIDNAESYSGSRSLKVSSGAKERVQIDGLNAEIVEFPRHGQYRYAAFAWKKPSGKQIQLGFANQGRLDFSNPPGPNEAAPGQVRQGLRRSETPASHGRRFGYRYEVGIATTKAPAPLWMRGDLPRDWHLVVRDLFADFGSFVITGVTLNSVDESPAWFDHLVLARSRLDLERACLGLKTSTDQGDAEASTETQALIEREQAVLTFSEIAPLFAPNSTPVHISRLSDFQGQHDVLQAQIAAGSPPLVFRGGIELENSSRSHLEIEVASLPDQEWPLVVRANGEVILEAVVGKSVSPPQNGWITVKADLSQFAGQKVLVEILCRAGEDKNQIAIWKQIRLVSP